MITEENLRPIVYALTLQDRPKKRDKWLSRGFAIVNSRNDFLFRYWHCRLGKNKKEDMDLYNVVLSRYNQEKIKRPSIAKMVKSLSKSSVNWILDGMKKTPDDVIDIRKRICINCEFWDGESFNKSGRCKKCGCSTWAKLRMATERCPLGKWESVSVEERNQ